MSNKEQSIDDTILNPHHPEMDEWFESVVDVEANKLDLLERVLTGELSMFSQPLGGHVTEVPQGGALVGWAIINGEMAMFYRKKK